MNENCCTMTTDECQSEVAKPRTSGTYRPRVDIRETDDSFLLVADVPGAGEDDIELSIEKDVLTLSAHVEEQTFDEYEPFWRGYGVGNWSRSFRINEGIEREGIDATIKDGVLRVSLPKGKTALKTSIAVKRAD